MPPDSPSPPAQPSVLADRKAFSILIRQNHRELLVYARALTNHHAAAQDIVQDAFVTAYQKIDSFDISRDFGAWMRGFVRNKHREWLRKEKKFPRPDSELDTIESDIAAWQEARVAGTGSVFDALENCLTRLPDPLKQAVDQFYFQNESGSDSAHDLGISEPNLRKRLQRARSHLRNCIAKKLTPAEIPSA
ncbi:MAG: sigma-70 family RNA polymerase sigma factor [Verrucomicrobiota bacterium]